MSLQNLDFKSTIGNGPWLTGKRTDVQLDVRITLDLGSWAEIVKRAQHVQASGCTLISLHSGLISSGVENIPVLAVVCSSEWMSNQRHCETTKHLLATANARQ